MESTTHTTPGGLVIRLYQHGISDAEAFAAASAHAVSVADQVLADCVGAALNYDVTGAPADESDDIVIEIERTVAR